MNSGPKQLNVPNRTAVIEELEKLDDTYSAVQETRLQCPNCGIKFGEYFKTFRSCPWCHSAKLSSLPIPWLGRIKNRLPGVGRPLYGLR